MSLQSEVTRIIRNYFAGSKKITELEDADSPSGAELVEIVQNGVNKKVSVATLQSGGTVIAWGGFISGPPTFPIDSDTQYVASADFSSGGVDVYTGSILFAPAGAADMGDLIIKP